MKKLFLLVAAMLFVASGVAYAPLVTVYEEPEEEESDTSDDTSVVDLSDVDTDQPTWSPSFENASDEED